MMNHPLVAYPPAGAYSRALYTLALPDLATRPATLALPGPHFVSLLCCDARDVPDSQILNAARWLLESGLVYLCTWGPGAERVRHLCDTAALAWNSDAVVLTTHFDGPLDEALGYFLDVAFPASAYAQTCRAGLAITVANEGWAAHIEQSLAGAD